MIAEPDRKREPKAWADWLADKILEDVRGAVRKELMEGGRKCRVYFDKGDYVDVHRYEEPNKYAVHYRHPSGRFARWNNALDRVYPRKPHVHVGVEGVRERKAEDLSMGDASSIIDGIKRERKKSARRK